MLPHTILYFFRSALRAKSSFFINLFGLSVGLASALLIYLWVNDELQVDTFHQNDSRLFKVLYTLNTTSEVLTIPQTPYPLGAALTNEMPEVEYAVSLNHFMDWFAGEGVVSFGDKAVKAKGMFASKDFFNVFSYRLLYGNKNKVLAGKNGVVITEGLAKKLFHTTGNVMGRLLTWDHRMKFDGPLYVAGVVENPPTSSTHQFDILFPFELLLEKEPNANDWRATYSDTYLVLKKGTNLATFNHKIRDFARRKDPANEKNTLFIEQFSKLYLYGHYENGKPSGERIEYVQLFSLVAGFILLIACINFMNLFTAQAARKMKEVGVRKVIGADRLTLIWQFTTQSLLMAFLALLVALTLINLFLPSFNHITGKQLQLSKDPGLWLSIVGIGLLTGFVSGCYPALYLSGFRPAAVLKGKLPTSLGELWVRKGLVVFQFTLSVIFIIGFLVVGKQIQYAQTKNLGYDRHHILTFKREGEVKGDAEVFLTQLQTIPGVIQVAGMAESILSGTDRQSGFSWRGQESDRDYLFKSPRISYGTIETLGLKVLQGRAFSRDFKGEDARIILNESAVARMGLTDPIGKVIKKGESESQIIGVVNDFHYGSIHGRIEPLIFRFRDARAATQVLVRIKPGREQMVLKRIESLYRKFHPAFPFAYSFLDSDYQALYASEEKVSTLLNYFAGLALLISSLGLFGLAAFSVERRRKEIGIRKVLGAQVWQILVLIAKDLLLLVLLANCIGLPIALWVTSRWLENFVYQAPITGWLYALAAIIAFGVALLTVSFQAMKAAVANPINSLRTE